MQKPLQSLGLVLLLLSLPAWSAATAPCDQDDPDACWMSYLASPPAEAVQLGQRLSARASAIVSKLPSSLQVSGDFDVSVSGGGDYDAYYLGIAMVISRVQSITQHRFTGASAGGMMPFEILLKSLESTLLTHLSYGVLTRLYPVHFFGPAAALEQDHHWRLMAAWQTKKYSNQLSSLNGKVFLALSCLDPLPKLVIVSNFTSENDQATHAFMATGTAAETYDGKLCSDGGSMSGPKMTPLFQDGLRSQLIVNLMETGYPSEMVYKVNLTQYSSLIELGQDEASEFLRTGTVKRAGDAITLCPKGSKVDKNICERFDSLQI